MDKRKYEAYLSERANWNQGDYLRFPDLRRNVTQKAYGWLENSDESGGKERRFKTIAGNVLVREVISCFMVESCQRFHGGRGSIFRFSNDFSEIFEGRNYQERKILSFPFSRMDKLRPWKWTLNRKFWGNIRLFHDISLDVANDFLDSELLVSERSFFFFHRNVLLEKARNLGELSGDLEWVDNILKSLLDELECREIGDLSSKYLERFAKNLAGEVEIYSDGLRKMKSLPCEYWTGSGGPTSTRLIAHEILRRGGKVIRFDHGGNSLYENRNHAFVWRECSLSTGYVVSSGSLADRMRERWNTDCEFVETRGKPMLTQRSPGFKDLEKFLYVPNILKGNRPYSFAFPTDEQSVRFSHRFSSVLGELFPGKPIDIQPHPEGFAHPLNSGVTGYFEERLSEGTVLIFEYVCTTTFSVALCSDLPIVLIDSGDFGIADDVMELYERRCAFLPGEWLNGVEFSVEKTMIANVVEDAIEKRKYGGPFVENFC